MLLLVGRWGVSSLLLTTTLLFKVRVVVVLLVTNRTALADLCRLSLGLHSFLSYLIPHHCALICYQMHLGHVTG
jgi:hypothetical protein